MTSISAARLLARAEAIAETPAFTSAALAHCRLTLEAYESNPSLYKFALKESRFCVILTLCALVFGNQVKALSKVKTLCARYHISGHNRIIAILQFLRATGRVELMRDPEDRRVITLLPTARGLFELKIAQRAVFTPLRMLYPACPAREENLDDAAFRSAFFRRAGESLEQGLLFDVIFPAVCLLIDKDAGRALLLAVFQLTGGRPQAVSAVQLKKLASALRVSRSHFQRLLAVGFNHGLFEPAAGGMIVTPAFIAFANRYIALYLAWGYLFLPPGDWASAPAVGD